MRTTADSPALKSERHDERRDQLAESALTTLGELGYARASLREIANNSVFSHGVVHYYFANKLELIVYCVRYYKRRCVRRYDGVVAEATTPAELLDGFAGKLTETIVEEAPMHRLWYDLRAQAMFDPSLREPVLGIEDTLAQMITRVIIRYAELSGRELGIDPVAAYPLLDGAFQQALLRYLVGEQAALSTLQDQVHELMPRLLAA